MSKKKQNSVLTAETQTKAVTAPMVSATGYASTGAGSKVYSADSRNSSYEEKAADDWNAAGEKAVDTKKTTKEKAEKEAEENAYRQIVREAYEDYRRNIALFPEMEVLMSSGDAENLFTQNDIIFQEQVKQEAARREKMSKKLARNVDALLKTNIQL